MRLAPILYGAVKEIPAKINAALSSTAGNAQEVAEAVSTDYRDSRGREAAEVFRRPQDFGLNEINALSKRVQTSMLEAFGLAADTKFLKG